MQRRHFIKSFLSGLTIPLVPLSLQAAAQKNGRRLILVELAGANDGLNTVIPYNNDAYYRLRPKIAIRKEERFNLNDSIALNENLGAMRDIWDSGNLAIIQGLGYPDPNRSHFKSIALWETGGDGKGMGRRGWLTKDIEELEGSANLDALGISLDGGMGIFSSPSGNWISMTSSKKFQPLNEEIKNVEKKVNNPALSLLLSRAESLNSSMSSISEKLDKSMMHRGSSFGGLRSQLKRASKLISSGINAPILKVQLSGFDTHEGQNWKHPRLLKDLSKALKQLSKDLQKINEWSNTIIFTYSEFGRTAKENNNSGTDHGTAAPHFLMGGRINGGLYGKHPSLVKLVDGDLSYTMDYRSVYDWILGSWFKIEGNEFSRFHSDEFTSLI